MRGKENKESAMLDEKNASDEKDLEELLDGYYSEKESINCYCENCEDQILTEKLSLNKKGPIVIIALKRFIKQGQRVIKIKTKINFGESIKLNNNTYFLVGVINHEGTFENGHYKAMVKANQKWMYFDDSRYDQISPYLLCTPDAYILVFACTEVDSKKEDYMYYCLIRNIMDNINLDKVNHHMQNELESLEYEASEYFVGEPIQINGNFGFISEVKNKIKDGLKEIKSPFEHLR